MGMLGIAEYPKKGSREHAILPMNIYLANWASVFSAAVEGLGVLPFTFFGFTVAFPTNRPPP